MARGFGMTIVGCWRRRGMATQTRLHEEGPLKPSPYTESTESAARKAALWRVPFGRMAFPGDSYSTFLQKAQFALECLQTEEFDFWSEIAGLGWLFAEEAD